MWIPDSNNNLRNTTAYQVSKTTKHVSSIAKHVDMHILIHTLVSRSIYMPI
jgi:hypothetical protein